MRIMRVAAARRGRRPGARLPPAVATSDERTGRRSKLRRRHDDGKLNKAGKITVGTKFDQPCSA